MTTRKPLKEKQQNCAEHFRVAFLDRNRVLDYIDATKCNIKPLNKFTDIRDIQADDRILLVSKDIYEFVKNRE